MIVQDEGEVCVICGAPIYKGWLCYECYIEDEDEDEEDDED